MSKCRIKAIEISRPYATEEDIDLIEDNLIKEKEYRESIFNTINESDAIKGKVTKDSITNDVYVYDSKPIDKDKMKIKVFSIQGNYKLKKETITVTKDSKGNWSNKDVMYTFNKDINKSFNLLNNAVKNAELLRRLKAYTNKEIEAELNKQKIEIEETMPGYKLYSINDEAASAIARQEDDGTVLLDQVQTDPQVRRKGYSRAIINKIISDNKDKIITLSAEPKAGITMEDLVKYYESFGFKIDTKMGTDKTAMTLKNNGIEKSKDTKVERYKYLNQKDMNTIQSILNDKMKDC